VSTTFAPPSFGSGSDVESAADHIVLGIETATSPVSVAVLRNGRCFAELRAESTRGSSSNLRELVETVLRDARVELAEVRTVVVGLGPGSFTGVRVGVAFARGLRLATGVSVVGAGTLLTMIRAMPSAEGVACVIDARKGELYACVAHRPARGGWIGGQMHGTPEDLGPRVREAVGPGALEIAGVASDALLRRLAHAIGGRVEIVPMLGTSLARLIAMRMDDDPQHGGSDLEVMYVRGSDAKLPGA